MNTTNPLLSRVRIPGQTFKLPSQGQFYKNGELDPSVVNGEVTVNPMTTIDEMSISTPDKLLSGDAVVEVFKHCIPQVLNPGALLSQDVDYLMVCLRMVSFGPTLELTATHDCKGAQEHTYKVDLSRMLNQTKNIDPTTIETSFVTTLENGQVVRLRPLTYERVVELYTTMAMTNDADSLSAAAAEQLVLKVFVGAIESVDGIDDAALIHEWARELPIKWKRAIEGAMQKIAHWGLDATVKHECADCGGELDLTVNLNPTTLFF